ncbi:lipopolysaccharide biosynthesis protein [Geomonas anaerohicana]|uniref:Oligosaccharide flippase family protein n=1 Tax=Geomonas anaerohicana TaxID=2798583 RepID=A0ABS0YJZ4_9BACT|nr:oligosaccharide flippase family protein [Geomonas anaerohicana]MBJ6752194.1 oligosaccharide flippase family protein [Geomonas anaerohicana]
MSETSLQSRFKFKLFSNVAAVLLGLITMAFVPRALGPENFGKFEFITNNFKLIFDTLTLQVPVAFFNWVSRKGHKEDTDVASGVTLHFSLIAAALFAVFIAGTILTGTHSLLWPGIDVPFLWEALLFTLVVFLYQLLVFLADGKSLTVGLERIRLLQNLLKAAILLGLVFAGVMNLHSYFFGQVAVVALSVLLSALWLRKQSACSERTLAVWRFTRSEIRDYWSFAWHYAKPLTILMAGGFLFLYFDRWFLQLIGGSVQQGYFGLSDRLGAIAFVFTSAMTPLLTREFAFAHEERNMERLVRLFERIKLFLFIAAMISCFMSAQSATIIKLVGGEKFKGAVLPIAIMALYPIHQTFGQLSGALLMATGQTRLYSKIGLSMLVGSVPITYFLLAPATYAVPGLGLGAGGLALKMVVVQLFATNIQLFCNTRYLKISYLKWLGFQFCMIPLVYLAAQAVSLLADEILKRFFAELSHDVVANGIAFVGSGLAYCVLLLVLVYLLPAIAGLSRKDVDLNLLSRLGR